jgi:hypothetical protein
MALKYFDIASNREESTNRGKKEKERRKEEIRKQNRKSGKGVQSKKTKRKETIRFSLLQISACSNVLFKN